MAGRASLTKEISVWQMLQLLALCAYLIHFVGQQRNTRYANWLFVLLIAGVLLQTTYLILHQVESGFGFFQILSLAALGCIVTVLALQLFTGQYAFLQFWFVPIACLTLLIDYFFDNNYLPSYVNISALVIHVLFSVAALSLVSVSSVMIFCAVIRDAQLKHQEYRQWTVIPAMETVKKLSKNFLFLAWLALSLAIVSGAVFIEDFLAQKLAHKTFFTVLSWLLLSFLLLWMRQRTVAWRLTFGFCLIVNISLALGYFGSRFVLEFILD